MKPAHILIVDDEAAFRQTIARFLRSCGYHVTEAADGKEALRLKDKNHFDLLLADLMMPGMDGIELVQNFSQLDANLIPIVMTAYGSIETAVEAVKAGAYDYITKPVQLDSIRNLVDNALDHRRLKIENVYLQRLAREKYKFRNIVGDSDEMMGVFELIEKVADSDSTILIYGESGTGKELVARAIHENSYRRNHNLIPVNCGAIPEELLESELFGHEKGAFTGAISSRVGRFYLAHGGTIFLDEIGDMSPNLQVKLLRVLQEHEFEPVGSTKTIKVDVRIIAATHQDLEKQVAEKRFREDLYYRLNVIPVSIPPLRERKRDIPLLLQHFIAIYNADKGRQIEGVGEEAYDVLCNYDWPGNVRELENTIERIVILKGEGKIAVEDIPERICSNRVDVPVYRINIPSDGISFYDTVHEFENQLILQALEKTQWNKNKAASLLQLNRTTLVEKIKKKQLDKTTI